MKIIDLKGEVGIDITLLKVVSALKDVPAGHEITINITSEGGCAEEGRKIYEYLKNLSKNHAIITVAGSYVLSAAFIIFLAGSKRIALSDTEFLMHNPVFAGIIFADEQKMLEYANELKNEKKMYVSIISTELGLSPEIVSLLMDSDEVITAETALQMGIIGEIRNNSTTAVQAEKVTAKSYMKKHLNQNKMNQQTEKKGNILKNFMQMLETALNGVKMIKIASEEGVELEFDTEELEVGVSKITNNAADGTYTFLYKNERKVAKIEGGILTALDPVPAAATEEKTAEQWQAEIDALKAEIERLKSELALAKEADAILAKLKAIAMPFKQPDGSYSFEEPSMTAEEIKKKQAKDIESVRAERIKNYQT